MNNHPYDIRKKKPIMETLNHGRTMKERKIMLDALFSSVIFSYFCIKPSNTMRKTIFFLAGLLSWGLWAQQETGAVKGMIKDAYTEKPIAGVKVYILHTEIQTTTDENGVFKLDNVPTGEQDLMLEKEGYETNDMPIVVTPGKTLDIGEVLLWPVTSEEEQNMGLINLTDQDLQTDEESAETVSGILQSGMDAFQRAAAFQFGTLACVASTPSIPPFISTAFP